MALFAPAVALSAFLLFQVQPLAGRLILPRFGGSASVWTACLLFFQVALLAGYGYAHWSVRTLTPRRQVALHAALAGMALLLLPVGPGAGTIWPPRSAFGLEALVVLGRSVGLPFFVLSATNPLLQSWFVRASPAGRPYRLFALSNAGSLAGLLFYPVAIEPFLSLQAQRWAWSAGFAAVGVLCVAAGLRAAASAPASAEPGEPVGGGRVSPGDLFAWLALAAVPSALLLAVTNHLTQNVAPAPFLWIPPLTAYLLSFIICFAREGRWCSRSVFMPLAAVGLGAMLWLAPRLTVTLPVLIGAYTAGLFVCGMACHGELVRRRPHVGGLTLFYLVVSAGGALGGAFVGLAAPLLFRGYFELQVCLVAGAALLAGVLAREAFLAAPRTLPSVLTAGVAVLLAAGLGAAAVQQVHGLTRDYRVLRRSFYGVVGVRDWDVQNSWIALREMIHGAVPHGTQFLSARRRRQATTYYGPRTGVGRAVRALQLQGPLRAGVVGLGAGTLATFGRAGDLLRFYEINPDVIRLAREEFSYLADSPAQVAVVAGDGRLGLEESADTNYDLLVIDAFSSGSIPLHFLTREAFALYARCLRPGGVLALHVSNGYLDLAPVIERLAGDQGWQATLVSTPDEDADGVYGADWVLATADRGFLRALSQPGRAAAIAPRGTRVWTDDYSNLFEALRWKGGG